MPKASTIDHELAGLLRSYKNAYGVIASAPHRREPMLQSMWHRIEGLAPGEVLPGREPWNPAGRLRDRVVLRLMRVLWRSGHRLGEICQHPSGEFNFLTRASVVFVIAGVPVVDPSPAQLAMFTLHRDQVLLMPPSSKPGQFGEQHAPFPSVLPYNAPISAAADLLAIELETPCHGEARAVTPLFADLNGRAFTYSVLTRELYVLLRALFGKAVADTISWHSIRIGLACALKAAGCPNDVIQLICRWACEESLHVYGRLGYSTNVAWTDKAAATTFAVAQAANLPQLDNSAAYAQLTGWNERSAAAIADAATPRPARRDAVPAAASPVAPVRRVMLAPQPHPPTVAFAPGDHVIVPSHVYPSYACWEYDGAGWEALILSRHDDSAVLRFTRARTGSGRPYVDVALQVGVLRSC